MLWGYFTVNSNTKLNTPQSKIFVKLYKQHMVITCWAWENEGAATGIMTFLPASANCPCLPAPQRYTSHLPPRCQSYDINMKEHLRTRVLSIAYEVKKRKKKGGGEEKNPTSIILTSGLDVAQDIICSSIPLIHLLLSYTTKATVTAFSSRDAQFFCDVIHIFLSENNIDIQMNLNGTAIRMSMCRFKHFIFIHRPSVFPYYTYLAMTLLSITCNPNKKGNQTKLMMK